jgi:DNA-binding CsgD family transcriptional regulator
MTHSLDKLTELERQPLRLLAQGHTGKTVARSLGLSTTTVNERLRTARRKTNAPSSRELARLLVLFEASEVSERENKLLVVADELELAERYAIKERTPVVMRFHRSWRRAAMLSLIMATVLFAYETSVPLRTQLEPGQSNPAVFDHSSNKANLPPETMSGTEFQVTCSSSDEEHQSYCAGRIAWHMLNTGRSDESICLPADATSGSGWLPIAQRAVPAVAHVSAEGTTSVADLALGALRATYPCLSEAQRRASQLHREVAVLVTLDRTGERITVAPGQTLIVEIATVDGLPVSRFSNRRARSRYVIDPTIGMSIGGQFLPFGDEPDRLFTLSGTLYGADGAVVSRATTVQVRLVPGSIPDTLQLSLSFPA